MALIGELYQPTLALLPIGDHFTMGPREAAYALKLLKVPHVLPIHYATFPLLTGTPESLEQHTQGLDVTIHALQPGETLR
jgi:L-ascorbate metabolism protein UlaG (beta-lactamase superfamily)